MVTIKEATVIMAGISRNHKLHLPGMRRLMFHGGLRGQFLNRATPRRSLPMLAGHLQISRADSASPTLVLRRPIDLATNPHMQS